MTRHRGSAHTETRLTFVALTVVAVSAGLYLALTTPASFGLTFDRASVIMDARPWAWTLGWVLFAVVVLVAALRRASILRGRGRPARSTTIRGAVWLWGSVVGSWVLVWAVWDLQMVDVLALEARGIGVSFNRVYALSGIVALILAPVWSVVSASSSDRTGLARNTRTGRHE
ncbi:hypothetical protein [Microbacterium sp. PMB16]|uniref:hypothetical protein n=1 Tax=Microbacterium sp. PMB16 TaxID=3120157 RepID=UPI003F4BCAD4